MTARDEIFRMLRNLALDREAVALMREDIAGIEEDEKQKELLRFFVEESRCLTLASR